MFDSRYLDHDTGLAVVSINVPAASVWEPQPHVASPALVARSMRLLERTGLASHLKTIPCRMATVDEVAAVHDHEYIASLKRLCDLGGGDAGDYAPASPETYDVALLSAGGALAAVDAVMTGEVDRVYALLRPPGHHAIRNRAMGFCFFNNVAIAARYAQRIYRLRKVAILDWDVHHGNGTQAAFYSDPSVLFISLHQDNWYPTGWGAIEQIGEGEGEGYTINIPLAAGTGNAGYLAAFDRIVLPVLRQFQPELILISAGQDANAVDPLGRMSVSADGFREMAGRIAQLADDLCEGRLIAVHEGGYSEGYAPICTWAVVEGLSGIRTGFDDPLHNWLRQIPAASEVGPASTYIERALRQHGMRWDLK